jgi:hypothetical protein
VRSVSGAGPCPRAMQVMYTDGLGFGCLLSAPAGNTLCEHSKHSCWLTWHASACSGQSVSTAASEADPKAPTHAAAKAPLASASTSSPQAALSTHSSAAA